MNWTEPKPPTKGESFYDHVKCNTPIGEIRIEWKSWKDSPSYDIELNRTWIGTEYDLDDAKKHAIEYLIKISNELLDLIE